MDVTRQLEVIVDLVGLRACGSLEILRTELSRIVGQKKLQFLREKRAISGEVLEVVSEGELRLTFEVSYPGGFLIQNLRTRVAPHEGAHIVFLFSMSVASMACSLESLEQECVQLQERLTILRPI